MNKTNHDNSQTKNTNEKHIRRLDYLEDCLNGTPFDMIPSLLGKAYLNGTMAEPKFKLIFLCIHHAPKFEIWRTTLEKTVSKASLKKYLPQLIDEGYLEVDAIPTGRGGAVKKVYHVRSVEHWAVYRNHVSPNGAPVNRSPVNRSPVNRSPTLDITTPNSNQTNSNKTNGKGESPRPVDIVDKLSKEDKPNRIDLLNKYVEPIYCEPNGYIKDSVFKAINQDSEAIIQNYGYSAFHSFVKRVGGMGTPRDLKQYRLSALFDTYLHLG